jgi:hypothetical protein
VARPPSWAAYSAAHPAKSSALSCRGLLTRKAPKRLQRRLDPNAVNWQKGGNTEGGPTCIHGSRFGGSSSSSGLGR